MTAGDGNAVLPQLDFSPREGGETLFVLHLHLDKTSHFPKLLLSQLPCFPPGCLAVEKPVPELHTQNFCVPMQWNLPSAGLTPPFVGGKLRICCIMSHGTVPCLEMELPWSPPPPSPPSVGFGCSSWEHVSSVALVWN